MIDTTTTDTTPLSYALDFDESWHDKICNCLACPECGHEYTHLRSTSVHQRPEDADTHTVHLGAGGGMWTEDGTGNPSPRRDAVVLRFEGECGHLFNVTFIQHKGQTYTWADVLNGEGDR